MVHYEIGIKIGELSLPPGFDGLLSWGAAWNLVQFSRALADNRFGRDPSGATQGRNKIWTGIALRPWKGSANAPDEGRAAADKTVSQMASERRARRNRTRRRTPSQQCSRGGATGQRHDAEMS